jgi:hypothetical protein
MMMLFAEIKKHCLTGLHWVDHNFDKHQADSIWQLLMEVTAYSCIESRFFAMMILWRLPLSLEIQAEVEEL